MGFLYLTVISIYYTPSVQANANTQTITIYKFLDEEGVLHLTNKPPARENSVCPQLRCGIVSAASVTTCPRG